MLRGTDDQERKRVQFSHKVSSCSFSEITFDPLTNQVMVTILMLYIFLMIYHVVLLLCELSADFEVYHYHISG